MCFAAKQNLHYKKHCQNSFSLFSWMPPFCNNVTSQFGGATCLVSHVFVLCVHHSFQMSAVNIDRNDGIMVRRPDSQLKEPGFKSHCSRFEPLASLITPRCHSSLSCINEYLAIQTVMEM